MDVSSKIFVAGHRGMAGSAIVRELATQGYSNLVTKTRQELDLMNSDAVAEFFAQEKPEYVFLAAARVGGIHANNTYPADFIYENLQIQNNIIHQSYLHGVTKLLFLGSSCIYPRECPQPMTEEFLMTGPLEPTNEAYAIAKIAGIKMCQSYNRQYGTCFISAMPTNLYGVNDNFHPQNSHVLGALIPRFHEAKINNASTVTVWGTGRAEREFLDANDLANACVFLMKNYSENSWINVGSGQGITIRDLAYLLRDVIGGDYDIVFDTTKPDGTPKKVMDTSKLTSLGWTPKTSFREGLTKAYAHYQQHRSSL